MIDFLKALLFPRKCFFCGELLSESKERVFCPKCRLEYEKMKRRSCSACGKAQSLCTCVPEKLRGVRGHHLFAYGDEASKKLIFTLKRKNDKALQRFWGRELARLVDEPGKYDITFAPRKPKSVREFGFDQAERLAEVVSDALAIPLLSLFRHARASELQKNLNAEKRAENAEKSYSLRKNITREHDALIIVDDVMTTGSTMAKLISLAKDMGYEEILLLTVARTVHEREET